MSFGRQKQGVMRRMLAGKIHRLRVTHADLEYEGSLTLSPELLGASGIHPYEAISVWNVTRGSRFETYAIKGELGSGDVCVNGAAAHHAGPGDIIIVAAFADVPDELVSSWHAEVVFVDAANRLLAVRQELPGPQQRLAGHS